MAMWNPWRGCHRCSEGCRYCYIHKGDARRGVDTEQIVRTKGFDAPVQVKWDGAYRMKGGQTVYLCFSTDFLLEDADPWREECWDMIRRRPHPAVPLSDQTNPPLCAVRPLRLGPGL